MIGDFMLQLNNPGYATYILSWAHCRSLAGLGEIMCIDSLNADHEKENKFGLSFSDLFVRLRPVVL